MTGHKGRRTTSGPIDPNRGRQPELDRLKDVFERGTDQEVIDALGELPVRKSGKGWIVALSILTALGLGGALLARHNRLELEAKQARLEARRIEEERMERRMEEEQRVRQAHELQEERRQTEERNKRRYTGTTDERRIWNSNPSSNCFYGELIEGETIRLYAAKPDPEGGIELNRHFEVVNATYTSLTIDVNKITGRLVHWDDSLSKDDGEKIKLRYRKLNLRYQFYYMGMEIVFSSGDTFIAVKNGEMLWRIRLEDGATYVGVYDSHIFAFAHNRLLSYDLNTGKLSWSTDFDFHYERWVGTPWLHVLGNKLVMENEKGVFLVDITNGKLLVEFDMGDDRWSFIGEDNRAYYLYTRKYEHDASDTNVPCYIIAFSK